MNPVFLIPVAVAWGLFGFLFYGMMMLDRYPILNEDDMSIPQLILIRILFGPIIWFYSFYQILGLFGKR